MGEAVVCSREIFADDVPAFVPGCGDSRRPAHVPMMSSRVSGQATDGVRVPQDVVDVGGGRHGVRGGSWVQGVSVVPISQYLDHGMMNRTDFSVCRMRPTSPRMRSRGTTM